MTTRICLVLGLLIAAAGSFASHAFAEAPATPPPTADLAWKMLQDGNARYVAGKMTHPNQSTDRRDEVSKGQHPFAVILACADSRVAPEVIFDTGIGDVFVVRVAGNIADDTELASIEYAVEHLGSPLIVVEGHSNCGAVQATVDAVKSGNPAPGHLGSLIDAIKPAVAATAPGDDLVNRAVDANVKNVVAKISADEIVAHLAHDGKVKVVGGRYDLKTGEFKLLETPSAQAKPGEELLHVANAK